jgi:hypothetical protein
MFIDTVKRQPVAVTIAKGDSGPLNAASILPAPIAGPGGSSRW